MCQVQWLQQQCVEEVRDAWDVIPVKTWSDRDSEILQTVQFENHQVGPSSRAQQNHQALSPGAPCYPQQRRLVSPDRDLGHG